MRTDPLSAGHGQRRRIRRSLPLAIVACVLTVWAVAGCGSSSHSSTSPTTSTGSTSSTSSGSSSSSPAGTAQLCQARDQLKTSVTALTNPSLLTGGAAGIEAAVSQVQNDLNALKTAANGNYQSQVDAVQASLQQLQTAAGNLSSSQSSQNLQAVGSAIAKVGTTSAALFTALKTPCGS